MSKLKVVKGNELIDCMSDEHFSKFELQVIAETLSKISMLDNDIISIDIEIDKLYEECYGSILDGKTKRDILSLLESIKTKEITIIDKEVDKNPITFKWFSSFIYNYKNKTAKIKLDKDGMKYMLNLSDKWTRIERDKYMLMNNPYGIRLMELMSKVYGDVKTRKFEINKLRKLMHVGNKYDRNYHFKTRVIDKGIEEVCRVADFDLKYEIEKDGRNLKYFKFTKYNIK